MATDPIRFLTDQHEQMRKLFAAFGQAGGDDMKKKGQLVGRIIEALTVHTYLENEKARDAVTA